MESLVIDALSLESAEGFCVALEEFGATLVDTAFGYEVRIPLAGSDRKIIAVLNALEEYETHRGDGPARIEVWGRRYTMHPTDLVTGQLGDSVNRAAEAP